MAEKMTFRSIILSLHLLIPVEHELIPAFVQHPAVISSISTQQQNGYYASPLSFHLLEWHNGI